MNQKQIGALIIVIGIILVSVIYFIKIKEDFYIQEYVKSTGTCFLEDGTCLHDKNLTPYVLGWVFSFSLVVLGLYLVFMDMTQEMLAEHQVEVSNALKDAREKDSFNVFLSGFTDKEQTVLRFVKGQEGIKQSTLRYKTGMSKTGLSILLRSLEEREILSRKADGKTKRIFLKKSF
jgi:DNA-binding MarR family transcriptional regulator